jgi:hypothetical protein
MKKMEHEMARLKRSNRKEAEEAARARREARRGSRAWGGGGSGSVPAAACAAGRYHEPVVSLYHGDTELKCMDCVNGRYQVLLASDA